MDLQFYKINYHLITEEQDLIQTNLINETDLIEIANNIYEIKQVKNSTNNLKDNEIIIEGINNDKNITYINQNTIINNTNEYYVNKNSFIKKINAINLIGLFSINDNSTLVTYESNITQELVIGYCIIVKKKKKNNYRFK